MRLLLYFMFLFSFGAQAQITYYKTHIRSESDLKVYIEDVQSQADLKVMQVNRKSGLNRVGLWLCTDIRSEADKKFYFVKQRSQADLIIYWVDYRSSVGWINPNKKHLLD